MSDREAHIFELIDGVCVHNIEIVFSDREVFWNFHSGNLIVYDFEFSILEDEIITELNGNYLIKAISLDNYESFLGVLYRLRSYICDVDRGGRIFERKMYVWSENLSCFERKENEIIPCSKCIFL